MVQASIEPRRLQGQSSDDDPTTWFPIQAWLVEREVSYGAHPAPGTLARREVQIALAPGTPLGIVVNANRDNIADFVRSALSDSASYLESTTILRDVPGMEARLPCLMVTMQGATKFQTKRWTEP